MKPFKLTSAHKIVAFLVVSVLIVSAITLAVDGWSDTPKEPDSSDVGDNTDQADENKDGIKPPVEEPPSDVETPSTDNSNGTDTDIPTDTPPVEPPEEKYVSTITGLEVTKSQYEAIPYGVVVDPSAPLYGISSSDISFEFPIEDGSTRLLSYSTNDEVIWKIGTIKASRKFISNTSNFIGGIVVSYGNDDIVKYDIWDVDKIGLDLSQYSDCYYLENTLYIYTTENMITVAKNRLSTTSEQSGYKNPPFLFSEEKLTGATAAKNVTIPFSDTNSTELYYHEETDKYLYFKSGNRRMDMLNGKNIAYTNVFILFADATTYEKSHGTELVIDTLSGGRGYYISAGTLTEFSWTVDNSGSLVFKNLMGSTLTVNPGNSYVAYYKATCASKIKLS